MSDPCDSLPKHSLIPLSIYIHLPWCLHKCPYCDFNSHAISLEQLAEQDYVKSIILDLKYSQEHLQDREVISIFIGGGTPSLFSAQAIQNILQACKNYANVSKQCEITLESNPGTFEHAKFAGFLEAGVNRLSLGIQSFNDQHLQRLERIHGSTQAQNAIETAKKIGFTNINIDLMFGLPEQTMLEAKEDITFACQQGVQHISYYNLTLEPNTVFHKHPPSLPSADACSSMQEQGIDILEDHAYSRYEVSAYAQAGHQCVHNLNYWSFGDYLGVGAGAHSKITTTRGAMRFERPRQPKSYMQAIEHGRTTLRERFIEREELIFEFMLNNLRKKAGFTAASFLNTTSLSWSSIESLISELITEGLLVNKNGNISASEQGYRFLDNVVQRFLPPE